jgi:hypothetical protein
MVHLVRRFGWTPEQIRAIDKQDLDDLLTAFTYEAQSAQFNNNTSNSESIF